MTTIDDKSKMKILRRKAEELLKNNLSKISSKLLESETSKLLYELDVYQIELEMQNEELKQANVLIREEADKYTELYDFAPTGYMTISCDGEIMGLNIMASQLLGKNRSSLVGSKFNFFVSQDTIPVFNEFIENVFTSKQKEACKIKISNIDSQPVYIYLSGIVNENGKQCFLTLVDITELSLSIIALSEKEKQYQDLIEKAKVGISREDTNGKLIYCNHWYSDLFGYTEEELVGHSISTLVHHEDVERVMGYHNDRVAGKKVVSKYDFRGITKDGSIKYLEVHTNPIFDNNKIIGTNSYIWDTSVRKKGELAINESKEMLQTIFDGAADGIIYIDKDSTVLNLNESLIQILGIPREDIVGISSFRLAKKFVNVKQLPIILNTLKTIISNKDLEPFEFNWKDRILEISAKKQETGHSIAIARDITKRKQSELNLRESEERFHAIFESATDGLMVTDKELKIIDVNPAFIEITGIPRKSLVGQSGIEIAKKFVNTRQLPQIMKLLKIYITGKQVPPYELNYQDKILEIHSQKQENNQLVGIIRDITDKKRALEALQESEVYNRSLFKTLPLGLALSLMDGTLVDVNSAYAELMGRTIDECKKLTYWEITPKAYDEQEQQQIDSLNKTGKYGPYEKEYIHKNGHLVPVSLQGKIIEHKGTKYIWSSVENITKRKKTEEKIQRKIRIDEALASLYSPLISPDSTMEDIAVLIKNQSQELTGSSHCYVATIDAENGDLVVHTLTEMIETGQCTVLKEGNQRIAFPMEKDGTYGRLWGVSLNQRKAFYTNDVENHSASLGVPDGHIKVKKFLSVPVMLQQELVGQISVANPSRDYNDNDVSAIKQLAEFYAMSIRKQRYVDELKTRSAELEKFNESMLDREMRIIELKEEINSLCDEFNMPRRFESIWNKKG